MNELTWQRVNGGMMRYSQPGREEGWYVLKIIKGTAGMQDTGYQAMQILGSGLWHIGHADSFADAKAIVEEAVDMALVND